MFTVSAIVVEMYEKAMPNDVLWAQGVGHTAYPENLRDTVRMDIE